MYSSIANSGYIFMSLGSGSFDGFSTINYLYMYFFTINFFFIIFFNLYEKNAYSHDRTWTIANFSKIQDNFLKFALTIAIMNFSGMPPFFAFFAKLPIIFNFVSNYKFICALIILIFSVLSAHYSVRMIMHIWFFNDIKNNYKINKFIKKKKKIKGYKGMGDENIDWGLGIRYTVFIKTNEITEIACHLYNDGTFGFNKINMDASPNWPLRGIKILIKIGIIISFLGVVVLYIHYLAYLF